MNLREKIYTIPINDAFDSDSECPFCTFMKKEENNRIDYVLGDSMMQPEERLVFNRTGFCNRHTRMMYGRTNKLSHALILETRLDYLIDAVEKIKIPEGSKKGFFGIKGGSSDSAFEKEFSDVKKTSESCIVCDRLNDIAEKFTDNLLYLYETDSEFREKFKKSKGFCVQHFCALAEFASKKGGNGIAREFLKTLTETEKKNLKRIRDDISWFAKKFDYRYKDEDWKNSRDALIRASEKTSMFLDTEKDG